VPTNFCDVSVFDQTLLVEAPTLFSSRGTGWVWGDGAMSMLMIRCPQTGQAVSTGIETDPDSFKRIPDVVAWAHCPHCGLEHAWWHDEAWLADGSSSWQRQKQPNKGLAADSELT
jgi:hypothetical protein